MLYHVLAETNEKMGKNKDNRQYFEFDIADKEELLHDIVLPYLNDESFQVNGYFLIKKYCSVSSKDN